MITLKNDENLNSICIYKKSTTYLKVRLETSYLLEVNIYRHWLSFIIRINGHVCSVMMMVPPSFPLVLFPSHFFSRKHENHKKLSTIIIYKKQKLIPSFKNNILIINIKLSFIQKMKPSQSEYQSLNLINRSSFRLMAGPHLSIVGIYVEKKNCIVEPQNIHFKPRYWQIKWL